MGSIKNWILETYWGCKFISAYAALERAHNNNDEDAIDVAEADVVLSLAHLAQYDRRFEGLANITYNRFVEDKHVFGRL